MTPTPAQHAAARAYVIAEYAKLKPTLTHAEVVRIVDRVLGKVKETRS